MGNVKLMKRIALIVLAIIIVLLGIRMCDNEEANRNSANAMILVDPNMIELKKLIEEEELCDDDWARKFAKIGKKIENDSNEEYLVKYYEEVDKEFIASYKELGTLSRKFAKLFLDKEYKKASKVLLEIKEKFLDIGEK